MNNNATTEITVTQSGTRYEDIRFDEKVTVPSGIQDVIFVNCHFTSLLNEGDNTAVISSTFAFSGIGIENSGRALAVRDCVLEGRGTAILSCGDGADIRSCRITVDKDGVGVSFSKAKNSIIALSTVTGAERSVIMDSCFNSVAVKNILLSVHLSDSEHLYVCDNEMQRRLYATGVNYLLADGNGYQAQGADRTAICENNQNINGDTVTDVDARLAVGANEDLLPHVDHDLFVGMERRRTVREVGTEQELSVGEYLCSHAEKDACVVLAPGAYVTEDAIIFREQHSNTVIYAYGAIIEGAQYPDRSFGKRLIHAIKAADLSFKGLTLGYEQQSCGQIYILEKLGEGRVLAVTGAGYVNEFSNSGSAFFSRLDVGLQRAGDVFGVSDYFVQSVEKNADGTMTVMLEENTYNTVQPGDAMDCRFSVESTTVTTEECGAVLFKDLTLYGYAGGFAFVEWCNTAAVTYYRMAITRKSGPIIDKATYDRYRALEEQYGISLEISVDEKGRYRGAPAHLSCIDGIHAACCAQGSTVISCLLEGMCDDAVNQKAMHARLSDYTENEDGTVTLVYKANMSHFNFHRRGKDAEYYNFCAPFKKGHRIFVYTADGQLVCDAPVLTDGVVYPRIEESNCPEVIPKPVNRFAVKVDGRRFNKAPLGGFDLTSDSYKVETKVPVDNLSMGSYGFHLENTVFRHGEVSGVRAQAAGGTVKNCTYQNISRSVVLMTLDMLWWGESGVVNDFTFEKNLVDHTGYHYKAATLENPGKWAPYTAISILGFGGETVNEDYMLYKNITIRDNKFANRFLGHYNQLFFMQAVANVTFTGNDFGTSEEENGRDKLARVLYLHRAVNIELSGNTYSPHIDGKHDLYVEGSTYRNIFGTDVSANGISLIRDKE